MRRSIDQVNVSKSSDVPSRRWLARAYLWACERLYSELAPMYDLVSWIVSLGQWRRWQSRVWYEVRGRELLEVGCGTGAMIIQGEQRGFSIQGIDRSPAMLAVAQRRIVRQEGESPLTLGDGRALPYSAGRFDSVIATFPADYILEAETLHEIWRVLRGDGRLVILGLWVELNMEIVKQVVPIFYGRPGPAVLSAIAQRVEESGFSARWVEQDEGSFTIGVLVAERKQ